MVFWLTLVGRPLVPEESSAGEQGWVERHAVVEQAAARGKAGGERQEADTDLGSGEVRGWAQIMAATNWGVQTRGARTKANKGKTNLIK